MNSNGNSSSGRFRFSLATAFACVTLCAVGIMAIRSGGWLWARVVFTLTLAILLASILGVIYRSGAGRAFWLGFALFGWAYLLLAFTPMFRIAEHHLFGKQVYSYLKQYAPDANPGLVIDTGGSRIAVFSFAQIIQSLSALLFAVVGGLVAMYFYRTGKTRSTRMRSSDPG